jgi:tellurite resistance protein TerC
MGDIANIWIWVGFSIFLIFALSIDTLLLDKKYARPHESMRAALIWTIVWVVCALIFNGLLWLYLYVTTTPFIAEEKAVDFFTGYLIEKTLSLDNLFAFYMVFTQLRIPIQYQQRVFSYGIWSAVVLRLIFILMGTWLVEHFHWILYLMGIFLLLTGIKMFFAQGKEQDLAETRFMKWMKRFFRVTSEIKDKRFFVRKDKLLYVTPLFIALIFIEISDVVFALDSIPAIFAITTDPFIVWSSNIFAILGLRAMYFLLAGMMTRFHLLKYGIALILVFVGSKMVIAPWLTISAVLSLCIIVGILVLFSILGVLTRTRHGS